MEAIRRFQEERREWEATKEGLEQTCQLESALRQEAQEQLAVLTRELEQLRSRAVAPTTAVPDAGAAELVRTHHGKQLALMATIDSLRNDLQQEQARARALEKRAAQAEMKSRRPSAEELDCTRAAAGGLLQRSAIVTGELVDARRSLERHREEVRRLEDETLKLREELNVEKQKVVELKKAAHSRGAAWKGQLEEITGELAAKHRLDEENVYLKREQARLRTELGQLADREAANRSEVERLRREVAEARSARKEAAVEVTGKMEEMEILSSIVGCQLVAVEQELTQQVQKSTQLLELFLRHALKPLATLRRCCKQLVLEFGLGELKGQQVPPMCDTNVHDLQTNLVKIVNLLRYSSDVLEAHEHWKQPRQSEEGSTVASTSEDSTGYVRSWLHGVLA